MKTRKRQAHGQTAPGRTLSKSFYEASKAQVRDTVTKNTGLGSGKQYEKAKKVWKESTKGTKRKGI